MNRTVFSRAREADPHSVVPPEGRLVATEPDSEVGRGLRSGIPKLSKRSCEIGDRAGPIIPVE